MVRFELSNNGDTAATLKAQGLDVKHAAEVLEAALKAARPHGRNYQVNADQRDFERDADMVTGLVAMVRNIGLTGYDMALRAHNQEEDRT